MLGLFVLAVAVWSVAARPSLPTSTLEPRQQCNAQPITSSVSDFKAFFAADGDQNKTAIHFEYTDADTGIKTMCDQRPAQTPVYPSPGTSPRYPCANRLVEFSWVAEDWRGENQLWLVETACPPPNVTDPQGLRVFEASGVAMLNLTCTNTSANYPFGPGRECSSPDFTVKYFSLEPRPFPSQHPRGS